MFFSILASQCFGYLNQVQNGGPSVNAESYVSSVALWGHPRTPVDAKALIKNLKYYLTTNVSFNLYMFSGGTNFAFTSGANLYDQPIFPTVYTPQLTSYDYIAPLDEAGDPTKLYFTIKRILKEAVKKITL